VLTFVDARAHALGAYKADSFDVITAFSEIQLHIARESQMHVAVSCSSLMTRNKLTPKVLRGVWNHALRARVHARSSPLRRVRAVRD
jgi:hypothetical protein